MVTRITNYEKIGRGLECLRQGLVPFISSRLRAEEISDFQSRTGSYTGRNAAGLDAKDCLEILNKFWDERFRSPQLGRGERAWVNELIDKVRNQNAHRSSAEDVSKDDTWRALDTVERLLAAIGSPEAETVRALRFSLRDQIFAPIRHPLRPPEQTTPRMFDRAVSPKSFIASVYMPDVLGGLTIQASERGLRSVRFVQGETRPGSMVLKAENQLREYLDGKRFSFDLPWDIKGTPFQLQVWRALAEIPYGETRSYADIACSIRNPKAAMAVGQANSRNPLLIFIPCHRVINAGGSIGGWGPGVDKKQWLLDLEERHAVR
jgi:methylated-DNA-[protein]-cysteine S-methyltransferase